MRYTVHWVRRAEEELTRLWLGAEDRRSVTEAAFAIEEALSESPELAGESRIGNQRIVFSPPLVVTFEVQSADRHVLVLNVRLSAKRR